MVKTGWLPRLNAQVWVLVGGRFFSQIGSGIVLFYVPIYFVNQVGLSATAVGGALSSAAMASVVGYFLAGAMTDMPMWGRRRTLMVSCLLSVVADGVFLAAHGLSLLVLANVLMGLGDSLYWPASGAAITDLTDNDERDTAFAVSGLADSLGSGLGIVVGGLLITMSGSYSVLFMVDGITFLIFLGVLAAMVKDCDVVVPSQEAKTGVRAWLAVCSNPLFLLFAIANILFTTYMNWMESSLPLYVTKFVGNQGTGLAPATVGLLFSSYVILVAVCQLPIVRWLSAYSRVRALRLSMLLWGGGFGLVVLASVLPTGQGVLVMIALGVLAIANVTYNPFAVALVSEMAAPSSRGLYLSLNAQCWSVGYLVGPLLGGWALDQSATAAHGLWAGAAVSTLIGFLILGQLSRQQYLAEKPSA
ncbi:MAG: MFS transporter [Leptolyngbya sp. SIO1E4]|nr:MFS transporter [Leptolyngbya sp. SIO1E4]